MALHITLLLTCVFFSKALTMKCYTCTGPPGTCTVALATCPYRCGATATNIYTDGKKLDSYMKTCADPVLCVNGSMNSGQTKVTFNTQCCNNADYCNSENAPDLPKQPLNGKRCYTCNDTDCSKTLACEGDETQCFVTTVDLIVKKVTMKGCSSKLFCGTNGTQPLGLPVKLYGTAVNMKCCEGNLCNTAQSLRVYFVMLVPLLSLFLLF
ncbi:urokinase plasminogen activator surface receptor [Pseudorasbora parva]|uniref:urokinase plasminogen activator surface receptor n=1 Tax=Pseudorasbora parva TaxID=51549 RepID=UPI00351F5D43